MPRSGLECVRAGTPVTLADGSAVPIEEVKVGDRITTIDLDSSTPITAEVERVLVHKEGPFLLDRLTISNGDELDVTPNHPIWVVGRGWVPASDLVPGDRLLARDPKTGAIDEVSLIVVIRAASKADVVYNLKTSRSSYVAADLLVHNKCVAAGSLIGAPAGPRRVEDLRPGDTVYGSVNGHRVPTQIVRVFRKTTIRGRLPGKRLGQHLVVTINHLIGSGHAFVSAGSIAAPDEDANGDVYDMETAAGNYYSAEGLLLGAAQGGGK